jgi:hypothetical protein
MGRLSPSESIVEKNSHSHLSQQVGACELTAAELEADEERLGKIAVPSNQKHQR